MIHRGGAQKASRPHYGPTHPVAPVVARIRDGTTLVLSATSAEFNYQNPFGQRQALKGSMSIAVAPVAAAVPEPSHGP